jgi:hypothetical protein
MVKTRKRSRITSVGPPEILLYDANPGRIHGATITSWNGPPEIDLASLFANSPSKVSVSGSGQQPQFTSASETSHSKTVRLSDGTRIIFATAVEPALADPA